MVAKRNILIKSAQIHLNCGKQKNKAFNQKAASTLLCYISVVSTLYPIKMRKTKNHRFIVEIF